MLDADDFPPIQPISVSHEFDEFVAFQERLVRQIIRNLGIPASIIGEPSPAWLAREFECATRLPRNPLLTHQEDLVAMTISDTLRRLADMIEENSPMIDSPSILLTRSPVVTERGLSRQAVSFAVGIRWPEVDGCPIGEMPANA